MTSIGHVDHTQLEFYPAHFELVTRRCEKIACKGCKQDLDVADNITPEEARVRVQAQREQKMAGGGDAAAAAACVSECSVDATQGAAADAVQCQTAEATSIDTEAAPAADEPKIDAVSLDGPTIISKPLPKTRRWKSIRHLGRLRSLRPTNRHLG